MSDSNSFNLQLQTMPFVNARLEFNSLLALFRNEIFRKQFKGYQGKRVPVKTHYFTWHGRPSTLLTYLLRDAIVGLESAVAGAVSGEASHRGLYSDRIRKATRNPFSLRKGGTAVSVYNGLPELIDPAFALKSCNVKLWAEVERFYREVRNPIFHASEVASDDPDPVWGCLELIWSIYQWLNSWHPLSSLSDWPIAWSPTALRTMAEIPVVPDLRVQQIIPERQLPKRGREHLQYLPADMAAVQIEEVDGLHIGTEEMLDISMTDHEGKRVKVLMSPHAAMRLLVFLAYAQQRRGWDLPDRL